MAAQQIQLNKPLWEQGGKSAPPRRDSGPAEPAPPRVVPTFGGFWLRLMALSFDVLLVVVIHNGLVAMELNEPLYTLGPLCPLLGLAVLFVLEVIVPTRLWPGQTLGKKMLRLRVVTEEGEAPPALAHTKRFVLIFAFFVFAGVVESTTGMLEATQRFPQVISVLSGVLFSLYLTQVSAVAMNPVKRGLHDVWAETYVIRTDSAVAVPAEAIEQMDDFMLHRIRRTRRMTAITFPVLILVFTFLNLSQRRGDEYAVRDEITAALREVAGAPVQFTVARALIDNGEEPQFDPETRQPLGPTAWVLQGDIDYTRDVPWEEVADSADHRARGEAVLDLLEARLSREVLFDLSQIDVPVAAALVHVTDRYMLYPLAATAQRRVTWRRRFLPLIVQEGQLDGIDLIAFDHAAAVAAMAVTDEVTASPASP